MPPARCPMLKLKPLALLPHKACHCCCHMAVKLINQHETGVCGFLHPGMMFTGLADKKPATAPSTSYSLITIIVRAGVGFPKQACMLMVLRAVSALLSHIAYRKRENHLPRLSWLPSVSLCCCARQHHRIIWSHQPATSMTHPMLVSVTVTPMQRSWVCPRRGVAHIAGSRTRPDRLGRRQDNSGREQLLC